MSLSPDNYGLSFLRVSGGGTPLSVLSVNAFHLGEYIVTHAPVAPWFSPGKFPSGAYLTIDQTVGDLIDWYNIQFYNRKYK